MYEYLEQIVQLSDNINLDVIFGASILFDLRRMILDYLVEVLGRRNSNRIEIEIENFQKNVISKILKVETLE